MSSYQLALPQHRAGDVPRLPRPGPPAGPGGVQPGAGRMARLEAAVRPVAGPGRPAAGAGVLHAPRRPGSPSRHGAPGAVLRASAAAPPGQGGRPARPGAGPWSASWSPVSPRPCRSSRPGSSPVHDLVTTPAFTRAVLPRTAAVYQYPIRLRGGSAGVGRFAAALRSPAVTRAGVAGYLNLADQVAAVTAAIHPQVIGWWLLAALAALVALAVIGQALARQGAAGERGERGAGRPRGDPRPAGRGQPGGHRGAGPGRRGWRSRGGGGAVPAAPRSASPGSPRRPLGWRSTRWSCWPARRRSWR